MAKSPTILEWILRATNVVIIILGITLLALGGFLITLAKQNVPASSIFIALGVIDVTFGLIVVVCYRSLFLLRCVTTRIFPSEGTHPARSHPCPTPSTRLYGLIIGLLELAQITIAILFKIEGTRNQLIDEASFDDKTVQRLKDLADPASWVLLGIVGFQLIVVVLVFFQMRALDKPFDECAWWCARFAHFPPTFSLIACFHRSSHLTPPSPHLAAAYEEEATQARSLLGAGGGGKDRFGALSDELAGPSASDRYKEKHGSYYAKYGLK